MRKAETGLCLCSAGGSWSNHLNIISLWTQHSTNPAMIFDMKSLPTNTTFWTNAFYVLSAHIRDYSHFQHNQSASRHIQQSQGVRAVVKPSRTQTRTIYHKVQSNVFSMLSITFGIAVGGSLFNWEIRCSLLETTNVSMSWTTNQRKSRFIPYQNTKESHVFKVHFVHLITIYNYFTRWW